MENIQGVVANVQDGATAAAMMPWASANIAAELGFALCATVNAKMTSPNPQEPRHE